MSEVILLIIQIVFFIVDFSLFCCSVIGNSLVIYVISRDKKLKSKSNFHILSVAFADLLIGLFGIPLGVWAVSKRNQSVDNNFFLLISTLNIFRDSLVHLTTFNNVYC